MSWTIHRLVSDFWLWLPGVAIVRSPSPKERSVPQSQPPLEFVPPATPPGRHQWVPDESESLCMVCCREHFTMVSSIRLRFYLKEKLKKNSSLYSPHVLKKIIGIFRKITKSKTLDLSLIWPECIFWIQAGGRCPKRALNSKIFAILMKKHKRGGLISQDSTHQNTLFRAPLSFTIRQVTW